jgi:hypothetical protein
MAGVGCLLYLPFLSIQLNPNGLNEAIGLEHGGAALFSPNHMLYRPLGWLVWQTLNTLGISISSITVLQFMSGIFGALAGFGVASASSSFSKRSSSSFLVTIWVMTTVYFWASCTDAFYIAPTAALVAVGAAIVSRAPTGYVPIVGLGLVTALAILMWQAAILIVPAYSLALLVGGKVGTTRERLLRIGIFLVTAGGITAGTYVLVGIRFFNVTSPLTLFQWFSSYGGSRLPMWGTWSSERLVPLLETIVASLVPLRAVGGFPGLFLFSTKPHLTLLCWLSVVANASLLGLGLWSIRRWIQHARNWNNVWPIVGFVTFLPFLAWWDPFEPKWMVVPNVFLAIALTGALDHVVTRRKGVAVVAILVLLSASVSFWTIILPRKTTLSARQRQASCIGQQLTPDDMFIATDWKWNAYLTFFHKIPIESLLGKARPTVPVDKIMAALSRKVRAVQESGGRCFVVDPGTYRRRHLDWFESQTGLSEDDLSRIHGRTAFKCGPYSFLEITEVD